MPRGKRTPAKIRAAAAALLLTGEPTVGVADAVGLPHQTVSDIGQAVRQEKSYDYPNLVAEYTAKNLQSLTAQVELFGDPTWLRGQPAGELAVLHGVQADKAIAILSAWQQPDGGDPARDPIDGSIVVDGPHAGEITGPR